MEKHRRTRRKTLGEPATNSTHLWQWAGIEPRPHCERKINYQTSVEHNGKTVINASAAVTLLEQRPEKNSGSERDSNPRPLQCRCSALQTELSKPQFLIIKNARKREVVFVNFYLNVM